MATLPSQTARLRSTLWPEAAWDKIGILALVAYALFWLLAFDISQAAESVMILAFLVTFFRRSTPAQRRDPLLLILLFWIGYQFIFVPIVIREFPDLATGQIEFAQHYSKIALIFVVAWWVRGSSERLVIVLSCAVIGFLLGAIFQENGVIDAFQDVLRYRRVGFGYRNAEHTAVYASFSLFFLIFLRKRIVRLFGSWKWVGYALWTGATLFSIAIIILTQTRATWLGLILSTGLVGLASVLIWLTGTLTKERCLRFRNIVPAILVFFLLFASLYGTDAGQAVKKRFAGVTEEIQNIMKGKFRPTNIPERRGACDDVAAGF